MKISQSILLIIVCGWLTITMSGGCGQPNRSNYSKWEVYNGNAAGMKYSDLTQIDTLSVSRLKPAWIYRTGDADTIDHLSQIQCNPIIIDDILYGISPRLHLFAVEAMTGKELWMFDPFDSLFLRPGEKPEINACRGIVSWKEGTRRFLFYTAGSLLYKIDAVTGKIVSDFGKAGTIDLHLGLGRDIRDLYVTSTSPGIVFQDLIIIGSRVSEGSDAAPGHIRAYDTRTGEIRWVFHTIPQPGEFGYESWDDTAAYRHIGGANAWSGFTIDTSRGILFAPLGSASFDFYGGKRKGNNLFADCLVALDAKSGKRIWHFQNIHHDVWDWDLSSPPVLLTVEHNRKKVDAVAQATKTGYIFLFDRESGKPLFPVEEVEVPHGSDLEGEQLSPTQPKPVLPAPFARQVFKEYDINPYLPDSSKKEIRQRLKSLVNTGSMFNPPSRKGSVILPGFDGGAEWGGPAVDPETGILYINANNMANILTMIRMDTGKKLQETNLQAGQRLYKQNCMTCHGSQLEGSGNYPSLQQIGNRMNKASFLQLLSAGRRMMPSFKQLSSGEHHALAAFLLGLKTENGRKANVPAEPIDSFRILPYSMTGYNKFLSKEGFPALRPPWGTLTAIDLNTGQISWQEVIGNDTAFAYAGVPTGTENYGAPVVTKGGLLFIAATKDGMFRAYNKRNGRLLWEYRLPVPGFATPAVYEVNNKQYIVIACGGGKLNTRSGDYYIAFALPEP